MSTLRLGIIGRFLKIFHPTKVPPVQTKEESFKEESVEEEKQRLLDIARKDRVPSWRLWTRSGTSLWNLLTPSERWDLLSDFEKKHYPNPPTGRYGRNIFDLPYEGDDICHICGGEFLPMHIVVDDDRWDHKGKAHEECRENELVAADLMGI